MKAFNQIQDGMGTLQHKLQSMYVDYIAAAAEVSLLFWLSGIILQYSEALHWSMVMYTALLKGRLHAGIQTG